MTPTATSWCLAPDMSVADKSAQDLPRGSRRCTEQRQHARRVAPRRACRCRRGSTATALSLRRRRGGSPELHLLGASAPSEHATWRGPLQEVYFRHLSSTDTSWCLAPDVVLGDVSA